ncbi:MAG: hypothetical protein IJC43_09710 [Clostridia bacterium]|nr:hypothetical protein [Clostridia bacterium]
MRLPKAGGTSHFSACLPFLHGKQSFFLRRRPLRPVFSPSVGAVKKKTVENFPPIHYIRIESRERRNNPPGKTR